MRKKTERVIILLISAKQKRMRYGSSTINYDSGEEILNLSTQMITLTHLLN